MFPEPVGSQPAAESPRAAQWVFSQEGMLAAELLPMGLLLALRRPPGC
ncbi:MAG: hypothetical protein V7609_2274 [Verrucomicrobiota bacterium]